MDSMTISKQMVTVVSAMLGMCSLAATPLPPTNIITSQESASVHAATDVSPSRGIQRLTNTSKPERVGEGDYRTYQGHNNNLTDTQMGSVDTNLARWTDTTYADQMAEPVTVDWPSPRHVSNTLFEQTFSVPNPVDASDYQNHVSDWRWTAFATVLDRRDRNDHED